MTCPYLLQRLCRDLQLIGVCDKQKIPFPLDFFGLQKEEAIVEDTGESTIFLEELSFNVKVEPEIIGQLIPFLTSLIRHEFMQSDVVKRLTIIHDEEFAHFARYGLPVMSRNKLEDETKKSENLWQEETIPPDSLFYTLLIARNGKEEVIEELADHLKENVYLQVGGNETVGQGWMVTKLMGRVG
ncbi:type III-B CRISPR module RAMP protein Cmr4 [Thermoactinomyces sp. CICC 10522]|uniref:type III-B CRISPR module RAMP protein Cmr4 n=1 Tax=Thermoactinomyces sp. CICC 10522 TaxID=2767427 RepID=UPI00351BFD05